MPQKIPVPSVGGAPCPSGNPASPSGMLAVLRPYIAIARPDHWFKNVFMLLGVVLAYFYQLNRPGLAVSYRLADILWALAAVCLVASSNYVINEILDAPYDRQHPTKRSRPVASGQVDLRVAYAEWVALGVIGLALALAVNGPFFGAALALLVMGVVYNVRPLRTKEWPYVDVLSESANNPLRLLLGWFAVSPGDVPPVSLVVAYWMAGAFFMASKRFAEYRTIGRADVAAAYRNSFRYYDEPRLLISMFFYATAAALLLGVFIVRYHVELILSVPLIAGFFAYYLKVTLKPDSAVQNPERLYRERKLMAYLILCLTVFVALMFVEIGWLRQLLNVGEAGVPPLWRF